MDHSVVGAYLVAAHLLALPAAGQVTSDGQLRGTVRDATGAVVVSASVAIASPQLIGGPRTLSTGSDGQWRAPALPPGEYTLNVTAPGFDAVVRDGVRVIASATLIVDVELTIAPLTERTQVELSRPVVDVTTASVSFNLGETYLRGLPTSRTFADLINLVPGVAGDQAFGGSKRSNGLYIDGLDTTEASEQNPWLRFNQNWFEEVQIVGLGAEAEYGLSTGVTASAIIKSGSNRYAGLGEFWATPGKLVANNTKGLSQTLQRQFASERIESYWNANGQMGGPVRTDRLWFFAGVDHTTKDRAPAGYSGSDTQQESDAQAIGKLTWNAWPSGRLEGFLQGGRRQVDNFGIGPFRRIEATSEYRQPQLSGTVRATQWVGRSFLFDGRYSGFSSPEIMEPQPPGSRNGPPGRYDDLTGVYTTNAESYSRYDRWRRTLAFSSTWYGSIGGVIDEVKLGLQLERAREGSISGYPGGRFYDDLGSTPSVVYLRDESSGRADIARLTLFLQHRLRLHPRVNLLPGLRLDRFRASTAEADNVLSTNPLSPRVGLAWDVSHSHRTVVRAHVGRYTDPAFAQPVFLTDDSDKPIQIVARVVAPEVFEETQRQDFRGRRFDPDIRHSYVDQFVGGIEHQLLRNLSVLGQYIHREFPSFIAFADENISWVPVDRRDPGPDGVAGTADDGAMFTVYGRVVTGPVRSIYQNLDNAWRQYRGGQIIVRTVASGAWQMQASLTRSQTRGTVSTSLHANAGVRLHLNNNPNRLINGDTLGFDPTNEVKLLGVASPASLGGWVIGGVYRYLTGGAWGRTFTATGLPQGSESIRAEPRGTRRLPAINQLDLHIEKTVRLGGKVLGGFADVFNVWNQGVPDSESPDIVFSNSGPSLGVPVLWRPPRQVRVGLRFDF